MWGNFLSWEVVSMLKQVVVFDVILAVVSTIAIHLIYNSYSLIFLLGLIVASLSFVISGIAVNSTLLDKMTKLGILANIINFAKVIIICIIGILIFNNNINNVISYILGFTSHFIALFLYGIFTLLNERK
jgi:ATP synthase protein I